MTLRQLIQIIGLLILALNTQSAFAYTSDEHRLICTELGITPEAMAAFGMNSVQTRTALDRIDELDDQINVLRSLQEQHRTSTRSLKQAQKNTRLADSVSDVEQLDSQITQLELDLAALSTSIEAQQDLIRSIILPSGIDAILVEQICEPEGMAAFVPVEFRFVVLIEDDYTELLPALGKEQHAIASGESVDIETQLTLSRYRSLPAVQTARSNLLYNLDAVRGVFYE